MIRAYLEMFDEDRDFSSRTGVKRFWRAAAFDIIQWVILIVSALAFRDLILIYAALAAAYLLVTFSARLALWFRRLHDVGVSGTFCLAVLVPVLGLLALCFIFMSESQKHKNRYGERPSA